MTKLLAFAIFLVLVWDALFLNMSMDKEGMHFLDHTHTDILKGYAILFILFGHVGQYLGINGIEFPAGVGVSLFLVLSGYGLAVSYRKYGLKRYWEKRIQRVWIPYIISNGMFLIISVFSGKSFSMKDIMLNFTLIKPLYAFGWYLRYIFVCYLIFYFTCKFTKNRTTRMIATTICFAGWFIIRSTILIDSTPFLQARQMLAFPLGILSAVFSDKIESKLKISKGHSVSSIICVFLGTGIYGFLHVGIITTDMLLLYNMLSLFTCVICAIGFMTLVFQWRLL